ncbi:MAG TPA: ABC-F family ATP-binding cassette domain-containing protein [Candidatus Fimimorpha excrementavium]|nr:ABC-F family ATP-binding cassette domain-containing protein [Candidatus Fimimorpha excrementavium]
MNILNIEHVTKVFGEKKVLDDVSQGIQEGDKIGIIGINGTGKTTLLNMIAGEEEPDEGQIVKQNGLKIAYLSQSPVFPENKTVLECMSDCGEESEAKKVLNKLGITDHYEKMETLSGGQKKRVALARILAGSFDVLMLDEPTNHLDDGMIAWLEEYLNRFKGVVILVTHDRYFLDKVTNRIWEIDHGKLYSYEANYSQFLERKAEREEMELASERKRQSVLRMELEWAKRGCRARSTKQRARLERLEALKNGKAPVSDQTIAMDAVETRMGKKTIELRHVSKSFGEKTILDDFSYIVLRNQRLGIIGPNGCGKSTLLKIIAGQMKPDEGEVEVGETIKIGYFPQEVPDMDSSQKVIDYIRDVAEYIPTKEGRMSASQMLEQFLFTPQMQYAPIGKLSGGEKKRLYLLKVIFTAPNVLLFDEISNDLDIPTITILEDFINSFSGIVIAVSHDRYFLDNVADRMFAFEEGGRLRQYEGGYTDYLEAKKRQAAETEDAAASKKTGKTGSGKDWKQNRTPKLKFSFQEQREFETIDDDIAVLEETIGKLDEEMMKNATNSAKLSELLKEKEDAQRTLEEKMDRWVYLNDLAERMERQREK